MKRNAVCFTLLVLLTFGLLSTPAKSQDRQAPPSKFVKHEKVVPNHYIVVLNDDVVSSNAPRELRYKRIKAIANRHAKAYGGKVFYIYETALKGYSIQLPNEAAAIAISKLRIVKYVEEDAIGGWDQADGVLDFASFLFASEICAMR